VTTQANFREWAGSQDASDALWQAIGTYSLTKSASASLVYDMCVDMRDLEAALERFNANEVLDHIGIQRNIDSLMLNVHDDDLLRAVRQFEAMFKRVVEDARCGRSSIS